MHLYQFRLPRFALSLKLFRNYGAFCCDGAASSSPLFACSRASPCVGRQLNETANETCAAATVDGCGGPDCEPCAPGMRCRSDSDCKSKKCSGDGICELGVIGGRANWSHPDSIPHDTETSPHLAVSFIAVGAAAFLLLLFLLKGRNNLSRGGFQNLERSAPPPPPRTSTIQMT